MHAKAVLSSRDRILSAGKELFATRGYENTSTIMIARAAGTSESQLVKHFGSKDGLLEAIFDAGWATMQPLIQRAYQCRTPEEKLRTLVENVLLGLERDPQLKELMLLEARRVRKSAGSVLLSRSFVEVSGQLESFIAELARQGGMRPEIKPAALRSALIGVCEGMLRDQVLLRRSGVETEYSGEDIRLLVNALLCGCLATPAAKHAVP